MRQRERRSAFGWWSIASTGRTATRKVLMRRTLNSSRGPHESFDVARVLTSSGVYVNNILRRQAAARRAAPGIRRGQGFVTIYHWQEARRVYRARIGEPE